MPDNSTEYSHLSDPGFSQLVNLGGTVAIVTGGTMGIGGAVSRRILQAGGTVIAAAIAEGDIESLQADFGDRVEFFHCDVTEQSDVENLFTYVESQFGRLDALVNNAGIYPLCDSDEISEEFFDNILAVNLKGSFFACQQAMRVMRNGESGGAIVNLSSICGHKPMPNHCAYDSTKGAVLAMTRNLARTGASDNIRVNSVSPGLTATPGNLEPELFAQLQASGVLDNIPLGRAGEPFEIANTILFLVSPMSSYVTGADLLVDGGWILHGI